ncbi:hypothetical protein [Vibrio neptunius]|uniref:hypothetical protein n=1 Tax=Vibrio neptunius TaxID=170651 RepID=UPI000A702C3C|nr:hypothetical protein [Vibrio neptunius]
MRLWASGVAISDVEIDESFPSFSVICWGICVLYLSMTFITDSVATLDLNIDVGDMGLKIGACP